SEADQSILQGMVRFGDVNVADKRCTTSRRSKAIIPGRAVPIQFQFEETKMFRRIWPRLFAFVALLAVVSEVSAQRASRRFQPDGGIGVHARVFALGSIGTDIDRPHYGGGGLLQVGYGRASALALGLAGTGGDYESLLVGGGLGVRLLTTGPFELTAFGGYGMYSEKGW